MSFKRGNAVTVSLWGDIGELEYWETRTRDVLELLELPALALHHTKVKALICEV